MCTKPCVRQTVVVVAPRVRPCAIVLTCFVFLLFASIEVLFELLKSSVMPTVVENASMNLFSTMSLFSVWLCIFCPCSTFIHCGSSRVLWYFLATVLEYLFGIRLGTLMCDDLMLRLWSMPPSHLLCVTVTVHFPEFGAMANWTSAGNPCGSHMAAISRKPTMRIEEQEVHTSDDHLQERECHREDSNTWSRRAHELSEQEMFACLTRADSWDERDSLCELKSAPKPMNNDWSIPNGLPSTPPGLPSTPQSSWLPHSNTNTTQNSWIFRRHVLEPPDEPAA